MPGTSCESTLLGATLISPEAPAGDRAGDRGRQRGRAEGPLRAPRRKEPTARPAGCTCDTPPVRPTGDLARVAGGDRASQARGGPSRRWRRRSARRGQRRPPRGTGPPSGLLRGLSPRHAALYGKVEPCETPRDFVRSSRVTNRAGKGRREGGGAGDTLSGRCPHPLSVFISHL